MQDEFTEKTHSEFNISMNNDIKHKAMCIWCYGLFKTEMEIKNACKSYGITYEQALKFKDEFSPKKE
jgi:hypothetical protein